MTEPDTPTSQPAGITINLRVLSTGLAGFGGLLIVLGYLIWFTNNPNFVSETEKRIASINRQLGPGRSSSDVALYREIAAENAGHYRACLLSSGPMCQQLGVGSVSVLNLAGILVLMAGGGLFFLSRRNKPA